MRRYYFIKSKSSKPLNSNHLFNNKVQLRNNKFNNKNL